MHRALVIAPLDPFVGSAAGRDEAAGWLHASLAGHGFDVTILGDGPEPWADIERALSSVSPEDTVIVHATGRLVGPDTLAFGDEWSLPLRTLTDWLAARGAWSVSFVLELVHDSGPEDSMIAAEWLAAAVTALGARERGYAVLATTRSLLQASDRIAFTRSTLPAPDESGRHASSGELVAAMYDRASLTVGGYVAAQSFTFVRGAAAPAPFDASCASLDALIDEATEACRWPDAVRLRVARLETLETPRERARELVAIARIMQAELRSASGALEALERARAIEPTRVSVLKALLRGYEKKGRSDQAFLAALAIEELGAADADQQTLVDEHRTVGPVRVRGALDAAAWELLRAPGSDDVLGALFAAVGPAAIAARVDVLRGSRGLVELDESGRLSDGGTVSAVRTLHFAARVLGVDCPALYVVDDVPGGIALVPGRTPATALGPSVLSGLAAKDLAFVAGAHLTSYRPEYHVLAYYPAEEDLTTLLFAAVELVMGGATSDGATPAVLALRNRLAKHLDSGERAALDAAVRQLDARGGQVVLSAWIRSASLTAARAGLLLCGDLRTATGIACPASREAQAAGPIDDARENLIAFCASPAHAALRARFMATGSDSVQRALARGTLPAAGGRGASPLGD